jgi:hypothetical protein
MNAPYFFITIMIGLYGVDDVKRIRKIQALINCGAIVL